MADLNDLDDLDLDIPNDLDLHDDLDLDLSNDLDLDLSNDIDGIDTDGADDLDEFDELLNEDSVDSKSKSDTSDLGDVSKSSESKSKSDSKTNGNNIKKLSIYAISSLLLIGGGWLGYKNLNIDNIIDEISVINADIQKTLPLNGNNAENKISKDPIVPDWVDSGRASMDKSPEQKEVLGKINKETTEIVKVAVVEVNKRVETKSNLTDIVELIKKNNKELDDRLSISSDKNNMEISKVTSDISDIRNAVSENNVALMKSIDKTDLDLAKIQNKIIELSNIDSLNELQQSINNNRDNVAKNIKDIEYINQNNIKLAFDALNSKISILEIDYAAMNETISSKDKEISILKNDIKLLNKDIAKISEVKSRSIENFQSFEIVGFDGTNKSVWLRDSNNNVLKVEKGTFIPEYGTAISILEDGNIVTRLGLVKITLED